MPKIAEIKSDEDGTIWCRIGRIQGQGNVIILTEEELEGVKNAVRLQMVRLLDKIATNEDLRTHVELA